MEKRLIITGGSDGLGLKISEIFIDNGYDVVCLSRTKPKLKVTHIATDLTDEESVENAISTIKSKFSKFDFLVNCAGIMSVKPLNSTTLKEIDTVFRINVLSHMRIVSGLFDLIKANGADVVNVGSTVGFKAYENQTAYGSSKWAVRGFVESLRLELKNTPCRVIGFYPGGFKSRITEKATGVKGDLSAYMEPKYIAKVMFDALNLPKDMEISEIIINRKPKVSK